MTEEKRAELENLARAATGGDWEISAVRTVDGSAMICGGGEGHDYGLIAEVILDADAAFQAAANPATVLDLLATIARLEAEKVKDGEALGHIVRCDDDAKDGLQNGGGLLDCIDNTSRFYQSADLCSALDTARARLSSRAKDQSQ